MRFHQLKLVIIEVIERTNFLKTTAQNTTIIPVFLEFENLRMSSPEVSPLPITVRNAEVFFLKKSNIYFDWPEVNPFQYQYRRAPTRDVTSLRS